MRVDRVDAHVEAETDAARELDRGVDEVALEAGRHGFGLEQAGGEVGILDEAEGRDDEEDSHGGPFTTAHSA